MRTMFSKAQEIGEGGCETAVLPVGALEQHGWHLPVGTDTIIASELARLLAERLDAYLLPAVAIASSIEHRNSRATVYLRPETLTAVVSDIAKCLDYGGFRLLVVVNGHGGNWSLKPAVRMLNRDFSGIRTALIQTMTVASGKLEGIMEHPKGDVHAGEKETSLLLHLLPESVGPLPKEGHPGKYPQDFLDCFDIGQLTDDGTWGYPQAATAQKGRQVLSKYLEASLEYLELFKRTGEREAGDDGRIRG